MRSADSPPEGLIIARIDGASRGNPGPAAYGVVVENPEGARLAAFSKFLGQLTNNVAEYQALLAALAYALNHHYKRLKVQSDSELLARQIEGSYKVKSPGLKPLHERARRMIDRLEAFSIEHVPREQNREADRLANQALDGAQEKVKISAASPTILRAPAVYRQGVLKLQRDLPLFEGEQVELEIRRKKP